MQLQAVCSGCVSVCETCGLRLISDMRDGGEVDGCMMMSGPLSGLSWLGLVYRTGEALRTVLRCAF